MATLTIQFHEMFLYVTRPKACDVVLLPSGEGSRIHKAKITSYGFDEDLHRAEVMFAHWSDTGLTQIPGDTRRKQPMQANLLDLQRVVGRQSYVKKDLLSGDLPASVNGRIVLPNGATAALAANRRNADAVPWRIGKATERIALTDRVSTVVSTLPEGNLFVLIRRFGEAPIVKELVAGIDGNYEVLFRNMDQGCKGQKVNPGTYTLHEYRLQYALTDTTRPIDGLPVPVGQYRGETPGARNPGPLSNCLPICGGGRCRAAS